MTTDPEPSPVSSEPARPPEAHERSGRSVSRDPLRGSRAGSVWVALTALVVLLVLLAVFVLQNTQTVTVAFLRWDVEAPLAAALLIATAAGLLIAVSAGSLRILQLRHRVRRDRKG